MTAPINTESIPMREKPCAVMKAFSPSASSTKTEPNAYMRMYSTAYSIVSSVAPNVQSSFSANMMKITVRIAPTAAVTTAQLPSILSASSLSPFPIIIEARAAPPIAVR